MLKLLLCAAVATTAASARGSVVVGPLTNLGNGHRYYLLSQNTWAASEAEAVSLGGHLATINDATENQFLLTNFGSYGAQQRLLWIGLNDAPNEGIFRWASGETTAYANFAAGEPNGSAADEDYVAVYYPNHSQAGRWNDWNDRTADPINLPFNGVVEVVPEPAAAVAVAAVGLLAVRRRRAACPV